MEASRLATANAHNPAAEARRLHEDAVGQVPERLGHMLAGLPGPDWPG